MNLVVGEKVLVGEFYHTITDMNALNRIRMFINKEPNLLDTGFSGWYAIVSDTKFLVSDNESTALQHRNPDVFVQRIGGYGDE